MQVKVGMVPGKIQRITLDEGTTVADAIRIAGLDPTGYELRVNSTVTENFNLPLSEGAQVFLAKKVKGNDAKFDTVTIKQEGVKVDVDAEEIVIESGSTRVKDVFKLAGLNIEDVAVIFVNGKESNTGSFVGKEAAITYKTKEQVELEKAAAEEAELVVETSGPVEAPTPIDGQVIDLSALTGKIVVKTKSGEFTLVQ